mgnify:FL=1
MEGHLEGKEEGPQEIGGVGPVVGASIVAWGERNQNQDLVRRLVAHGVNPAQERTMARGGLLEGLTIVITGRLDTMSRNDAEDRIRELGGKVGSSVTRGTSYLVVGADAGSKAEKAEKLGTRLVTEDEFLRLIEGGAGGLESASGA